MEDIIMPEIISLNLTKGMSLDLTKHDNGLKVLGVGLGWQTTYDLDSIAFSTNARGRIEETVCYQHLNGYGVSLDGDDRVGGKTGDCETLTIDFAKVSKNINKIMILANIYNAAAPVKLFGKTISKGDTFARVKGSFIRLYNKETNVELCRYSLEEDGSGYNAFHFADLLKQPNGEWTFEIVGQGMNGDIASLRKQLDV
jgi:stress response protein SCP2